MLKIGFKRAKGFQGKIMAFSLNNPFVHCELIFSNNTKAASWRDTGTGIFAIEANRNPADWQYYQVQGNEGLAYSWFLKNQGQPYNWVGAFGGILIPSVVTGVGYNCCDSCFVALKKAGVPLPNAHPEHIAPSDLMAMLEEIGYKPM
jgi:hypothetical protein